MPKKTAWNLTDEGRAKIAELRAENQSSAQILVALKDAGLVPKTATDRGMRYHLVHMGMGGRRASTSNTGVRKAKTSRLPLWTPTTKKILERERNKGRPLVDVAKTIEQSGTLTRKTKLGRSSIYSQAFRLRRAGRPVINRNRGQNSAAVIKRARPILDVPIRVRGRVRHTSGDNGERVPVTLTSAQATRLVELLLEER